MTWFLYLVSVVLVVVGVVLVLYTDWMRESLKAVLFQKRFRFLSSIPLAFGILLIISAGWSEIFWLVFLLGVIALAKGLYLLFGSRVNIERALHWWLDKASNQLYRLSGVISLVLGMALLSWVR